jgi:Fic family protein
MVLFKHAVLLTAELQVVELLDQLRRELQFAAERTVRWSGMLSRAMRARAIVGSNSIEGYDVDESDALAALENEPPLSAATETRHALVGYRNAMTYALQLADDPHFEFNQGFVRSMHYMMLEYDLRKHPGRWRPGPMFVRDEQKQEIVYEAPPAAAVNDLMNELIATLQQPADCPAVVRAAMGHLNLVMIHPFSDGNGRMARCLQTLILAREGIVERQFCSIEEWLGKNTPEYYHVLKQVGRGSWHPENDSRAWIRFNLKAHYQQGMLLRARALETGRIWAELMNITEKKGYPERFIYAMFDATVGFAIRNAMYRSVAEVSENAASRDLKTLVDDGFLVADGDGRGRTYRRARLLHEIRQKTREPKDSSFVDPFTETDQLSLGLTQKNPPFGG